MSKNNPKYIFKSSRLGFRRWAISDHQYYCTMCADPEVMRYFPSIRSDQESIEQIARFEAHFDEYGYGFYAVDELTSSTFIGFIGVQVCHMDLAFCPCVEIGWRLRKDYWNKGYATEGALRVLKHSKESLAIDQIYSFTATINLPSESVMKKIGMQKVSTFLHPALSSNHALCEHVLYYIDL